MAKKLVGIRIEEVSLVDKPANRRRFAIIKRQRTERMKDELKDRFEKLLGRELTEDEITKSQLTDGQAEALGKQLDVLLRYREDLPPKVVEAIGSVACLAALSKESVEGKGGEGKDDEEVSVDSLIEQVVDKAMTKFIEALKEQFSELTQKLDGLGQADEEEEKKETDDEEITPEDVGEILDDELGKRGFPAPKPE